jgi:alcohol dehydrogenase (cytochrome c)
MIALLVCIVFQLQAQPPVPFERIVNAQSREPGSWLTYSGNYQGHRYSPLTELTPTNVAKLRVRWAHQFDLGRTEVSPIVADGVMYVTSPNKAAALDLRTGRPLWRWQRPIPRDYQSIGFGRVNRGPAILGDKLFVATLDCYIVALDLRTGQERWSVRVDDYKPGYSIQSCGGSERRRGRHPRFHRCLRCSHRQTCVAFLHDSRAG